MQAQLAQLEQDYGIEWRAYRLGELFDIETTKKKFNASDVEFGGMYRYVARGENNNGIRGYINEDTHFLNNSNTISFGQDTATMFYQGESYFTGDKIKIFQPKDHMKFNADIAHIVIGAMKKAFSSFSWGSSSYNVSILNAIDIQLPTVTQNGTPHLAFDFMEAFITTLKAERIATLKSERIATLKAYLQTTGLSDYQLTASEQAILDSVDAVQWGAFRVEDVLSKLDLKNNNTTFDKLRDTSTFPTDEFTLPLVNAKLGNNGIMFYGREKDFDSAEMTIDVVSNGAVATGTVYAQPDKTGVLWDAYLLKPIAGDINKEKLLYLAAALQKSIKTKFGWEDKAVWSKVKYEFITLPIKPDQTPDYDFMAQFISAMQKVVIKHVVDYADRDIAAHQHLVQA